MRPYAWSLNILIISLVSDLFCSWWYDRTVWVNALVLAVAKTSDFLHRFFRLYKKTSVPFGTGGEYGANPPVPYVGTDVGGFSLTLY
jgi:hypothetical protein